MTRVSQLSLLLSFLITVSASLEGSLLASLEAILTTAVEQGSNLIESDEFLEAAVTKQCSVSTSITCALDRTGQACNELVVPWNECGIEDMTFRFKYCNDEVISIGLLSGRTQNVNMFKLPKGTMAYINAESVDINLNDLEPGQCWMVEETRKVNTCWKMINSSLKIEGWRSNAKVGDYCYAWEFYRYVIKRPYFPPPSSCAISGQVSCIDPETGQNCTELLVPFEECRMKDMEFTFEYCNDEENFPIEFHEGDTTRTKKFDMQNLPPGTMAFIHTKPVNMTMNKLLPGHCRKIVERRAVNTCWKTIDASLKLEGWIGDRDAFCYHWDFYRAEIQRPPVACDTSTEVSCKVDRTRKSCDEHVVSLEDCGPEEMTFTFKYCSNEPDESIRLRRGDTRGIIDMTNLPPGTMAFIYNKPVNMNMNDLRPGRCRKVVETRLIDTCKESIYASLKLEGCRGKCIGADLDYCFSWDFYQSAIKRPPGPCDTSTKVACTVDRTGGSCDNLLVPIQDCGREKMTFTFESCNNEPEESIRLVRGSTSGNIDMKNLPQGTMAFINTNPVDVNLNDFPPQTCRKIVETRFVDTCWERIDASLKLEGWRGEGDNGDYCYSWDFYRTYFRRTPPTPSPTTPFSPCKVSAKISCIADQSGLPCEEMIIPSSRCGMESFTFTYEYCNNESGNHVALIEGNTQGNLDMKNLPPGTMAFVYRRPVSLDFDDMSPFECRVIKFQREITTCRPTIEASLKVEGWRGDGERGDFCFAWNFYKTTMKREETTPTKSPTSKCDVTADVSCVVQRTGQNCQDLVVPLNECGEETMTFTFEYCNNEINDEISLIEGDTSGVIDMRNLPKGTMAFIHTEPVNIETLYLPPGYCQPIVVTRTVSTCRSHIEASLKVEGWRGEGENGDFCFAWDFYKKKISRGNDSSFPTPNPTRSNTNNPTISSQPTVNFCGLPKEIQRDRISSILDKVSSRRDFDDPNSPQSKARDWILFEDDFDSFCPPPCNRDRKDGGVIQRYTMAVFYFATGGDIEWRSCGRFSPEDCDPQLTLFEGDPIDIITGNETWLEPVSECFWGGLSCRADTLCLDRIEFEANGVGGELPYEIEQLNLLRFLYLEGAKDRDQYFTRGLNLLEGTIPPQISTLTKLIILDLNFNLLEGQIPLGIYGMSNLRHLDIDHNQLRGSIPEDVKSLSNLRFLQLDNNLLSGRIPAEIGLATNLINALFHDNLFTGPMPDRLCELSLFRNLTKLSADCDEVACNCNCICDGLI